jgi:hypothetical protein
MIFTRGLLTPQAINEANFSFILLLKASTISTKSGCVYFKVWHLVGRLRISKSKKELAEALPYKNLGGEVAIDQRESVRSHWQLEPPPLERARLTLNTRKMAISSDHLSGACQALAVVVLCTRYVGDNKFHNAVDFFNDVKSQNGSGKKDLDFDLDSLKRAMKHLVPLLCVKKMLIVEPSTYTC